MLQAPLSHPHTSNPTQPSRLDDGGGSQGSEFESEWRERFPFTSTGRQWGSLFVAARDRCQAREEVRRDGVA